MQWQHSQYIKPPQRQARASMVPQPARIHDFRMLPIRDQAGERLRFVLGTNAFWHKGRRFAYGSKERPKWHACLYTAARRRIEVDCFWLAGTARIKVLLDGRSIFSDKFVIHGGVASAEEESDSD